MTTALINYVCINFTDQLFMGCFYIFLSTGLNTISIHNTCEDSLLAAPLIIDLIILSELMTRITYKTDAMAEYEIFDSVLSICSYLMKAPMVPKGVYLVLTCERVCNSCLRNICTRWVVVCHPPFLVH